MSASNDALTCRVKQMFSFRASEPGIDLGLLLDRFSDCAPLRNNIRVQSDGPMTRSHPAEREYEINRISAAAFVMFPDGVTPAGTRASYMSKQPV